jgi:hypothetical protein
MTPDFKEGSPQGATTGRWEIVSNIGKPPADRKWKRWSDVPLWYRVLDRFGLPTLFVLLLLWGGYRLSDHALRIWESAQARTVQVLDRLADRIDRLEDAVRGRQQ